MDLKRTASLTLDDAALSKQCDGQALEASAAGQVT
jgi:hypothetical protein